MNIQNTFLHGTLSKKEISCHRIKNTKKNYFIKRSYNYKRFLLQHIWVLRMCVSHATKERSPKISSFFFFFKSSSMSLVFKIEQQVCGIWFQWALFEYLSSYSQKWVIHDVHFDICHYICISSSSSSSSSFLVIKFINVFDSSSMKFIVV